MCSTSAAPIIQTPHVLLCLQSGSVWACSELTKEPKMTSPAWLTPIAKEAQVQPLVLQMLDSYLLPGPSGPLGLQHLVNSMTGTAEQQSGQKPVHCCRV